MLWTEPFPSTGRPRASDAGWLAARLARYRDSLVEDAHSPKELLNRASSLAPSERLLVFGEDQSVEGTPRLGHACCFVASAKQNLDSSTAAVYVQVLNLP